MLCVKCILNSIIFKVLAWCILQVASSPSDSMMDDSPEHFQAIAADSAAAPQRIQVTLKANSLETVSAL